MKRRAFLLSLGLAPLCAVAQDKVRRIGFLAPLSRSTAARPDAFYDAFTQGMRELGYVEGRNLAIEWRFADGRFELLPQLASELAGLNVEVIVTHSTPATRALQQATRSIPVVFAVLVDPVGSGFAASFARPGGNITGLSVMDIDPGPKRLELLKAMVPSLSRAAVLVNPGATVHQAIVKSVQAAGERTGVKVVQVAARTREEIEQGFAAMTRERISGVIVADDAFFRGQRQQIADLAARSRMPAIAPWREYVAAGGLMSYGQNVADSFRRAALYVDRILKGGKPADLPIEQPSRIHLAINRSAASALGLAIPGELALLADEIV